MLHDHRAFNRALNPDAAQALDDVLEPMVLLLAEQRKPQPKNVDDLRAWREQIADLEDQVARIADRGGIDVGDLKAAARQLIARGPAPAPTPAVPREDPPAPRSRQKVFGDYALEDAEITRQLLDKRQQIVALDREIAVLAKRQAELHRRLYKRGRRLGH